MENTVLSPAQTNKPGRDSWIDYLRSFITVLVVAHHSSLAYTTFAKADPEAYIRSTAPLVDSKRWVGLDIFENFNDVFFMALMFFIGGIFIVKSIRKKGAAFFIRDRFYRLFIPFLIVVGSFMLLAYYPAYHFMHPEGRLRDFLYDFIFVEGWPPGPPWFIWVLFLFNFLIALFSNYTIPLIGHAGNYLQQLNNKPYTVVCLFCVITWISYVPASWIFGAYTWTGLGPFVFQKSRFFLYFIFFILGSIAGNQNRDTGILSSSSPLVKKWPVFLAGCIFFYSLLTFTDYFFPHGSGIRSLGKLADRTIYSTIYTLSTCFSCLAFVTIFRKFDTRTSRIWNSLSENAYCIYLVHYIFVLWCQYALLTFSVSAVLKFSLTFIFSIAASWMLSILFRKVPVIKRYI